MIARVPLLAPYCHTIGTGLAVLVIASATLFLGEIVPRRIAAVQPEQVARFVSRPLKALALLGQPVLEFSTQATDRLFNALGLRSTARAAGDTGADPGSDSRRDQSGGLRGRSTSSSNESFASQTAARSLMTPRNEIVWIDLADSPDDIRQKVVASPHAQFPVCDGSLDNLLGVVHIKDLLIERQSVEPFRIKGRLAMPLFIYGGTRGLKILEMFKKSRTRWP